MSLRKGLDPVEHIRIGEALAPLRHEGVLIVASGMSYHNMAGFTPNGLADSQRFDDWLNAVRAPVPQTPLILASLPEVPYGLSRTVGFLSAAAKASTLGLGLGLW